MADWLWAVMFVCGLALGAVLGYTLLRQRDEQRERRQEEERARERTEQQQNLEQLRETMRDSFTHLALEALDRNTKQQTERLDSTLRPVHETLRETREKLDEIEKERHTDSGSLKQRLDAMVQAENQLRQETHDLTRSLEGAKVRGNYGELQLRRTLELAGMNLGTDFSEQEKTEQGIPDVIVRMPGNRVLLIDSKAPIGTYQKAHNEQDPKQKKVYLKEFAAQMRRMMKGLARRKYWEGDKDALEFVVMFVPGEHFLDAALKEDEKLMEDALREKVLLATSSSLMGILRVVEHAWNQQQLTKHAEDIRKLGRKLLDRVATFVSHLGKIHKSLKGAGSAYDEAIGSWQKNIQPTLTQFRNLGAEGRDFDPPEKINLQLRDPPAPPARDDAA